jgi:hypothetical protein
LAAEMGPFFEFNSSEKFRSAAAYSREILLGELHPHCDVVTASTSHAQLFNDCLILCGGDVAR